MFNVGFWIMDGERCLIMDFGLWIFNYFFFHPQSIIQHPSSFQAQLRPFSPKMELIGHSKYLFTAQLGCLLNVRYCTNIFL